MLWTIAVILLVLWALGLVSSYTAGGLVHLLLVIAIMVVVSVAIGHERLRRRARCGTSCDRALLSKSDCDRQTRPRSGLKIRVLGQPRRRGRLY
jgi:hypothetical protein